MQSNSNVLPGRNEAVGHNTEDKQYWCEEGQKTEYVFVKDIAPKINRKLIIHPEKEKNPLHIDLLKTDTNELADLKVQNTPFFTASRYSKFDGGRYDPQFTVTFNYKDYCNYKSNYPGAIIYWWVNWAQLTWKDKSVAPLYGVYEVRFSDMKKLIEEKRVPLHQYQHRINDEINAKDSYLFDLRWFTKLL